MRAIKILHFTERPDPPAGLEVIEIGSRSIRLLWKRSFDGNSPIRNYVIQYRSLSHGMSDDWNPVKTHNVTYTPGSANSGNSIHPTQNGSSVCSDRYRGPTRPPSYKLYRFQDYPRSKPPAMTKRWPWSAVSIQLLLIPSGYSL